MNQSAMTIPGLRVDGARFYQWMAGFIAILAFIGFSHTFFLKTWTDAPALPFMLHVHGIIATGWILLFLAQTTLIKRQRVDLHRRLGAVGVVLAVLFVASAILGGITITHVRGAGPEALARLALPFVACSVFVVLIGAGLCYRHQPMRHKRLMLLTTINALIPALGRLPYLNPVFAINFVLAVLLLACFVHDHRTLGRIHPVTIWGSLLVLVSIPARLLFGTTELWQQFASWLLQFNDLWQILV